MKVNLSAEDFRRFFNNIEEIKERLNKNTSACIKLQIQCQEDRDLLAFLTTETHHYALPSQPDLWLPFSFYPNADSASSYIRCILQETANRSACYYQHVRKLNWCCLLIDYVDSVSGRNTIEEIVYDLSSKQEAIEVGMRWVGWGIREVEKSR